MNYLFIDGSGKDTFVQAGNNEEFTGKTFATNRNLAARISEISEEILEAAKIDKTRIDVFAVCTGPGSLTGLRVANSFLRSASYVFSKPLIGIDLFSWTYQSLKAQGFNQQARLIIPALINKAFICKIDLSAETNTFKPEPFLADNRQPGNDLKNFGIRWESEGIQKIEPDSQTLHNMIVEMANKATYSIENVLKVLPMYVIPSQAERKLEQKKC
ncbi:MAG: tRNA threonylcarbamoyladenosine biosynthesis protein TsaB [Candidatus Rifleibacteriota bacterium]